jgi:hypothetical protein
MRIDKAEVPARLRARVRVVDRHETTRLPGYLARASAPAPTGEQALQLEYHLGEFLGAAVVRRRAAAG